MDLAKMIMGARAMLREKNLPSIDHLLEAYNLKSKLLYKKIKDSTYSRESSSIPRSRSCQRNSPWHRSSEVNGAVIVGGFYVESGNSAIKRGSEVPKVDCASLRNACIYRFRNRQSTFISWIEGRTCHSCLQVQLDLDHRPTQFSFGRSTI